MPGAALAVLFAVFWVAFRSLGVAFLEVPDRLGCVTERITPINHGDDFAVFNKLFDER